MTVIFKKAGTQFFICARVIGYEHLVGSRVSPPVSAVWIGTDGRTLSTERHCKNPMFESGGGEGGRKGRRALVLDIINGALFEVKWRPRFGTFWTQKGWIPSQTTHVCVCVFESVGRRRGGVWIYMHVWCLKEGLCQAYQAV